MDGGAPRTQLSEQVKRLFLSPIGRGQSRLPGPGDLDGPILDRVVEHLDELDADRDRRLDRRIAWALLLDAIGVTDSGRERSDARLLAAQHLLARGRHPEDPRVLAPYDDLDALALSVGLTKQQLLDRAGVLDGAEYGTSIGMRRTYAAMASGLGSNRDSLKPRKDTGARELAEAVVTALEAVIADDGTMRRHLNSHSEPPPTPPQERTQPPGDRHRRSRVLPIATALAVLLVGTAITVLFLRQNAAPDPYGQVAVKSLTPDEARDPVGAYWLPASAPFDELGRLEGGCGKGALGRWLERNGVAEHSLSLTVHNGTEGLLGISNVVAHGTTRKATPGLFYTCNIGGGDINWATLVLNMRDGATAAFGDERENGYFWHSVDPGDEAGLRIYAQGDLDFTGTISLDSRANGATAKTMTIPGAHGSSAYAVEYHGAPAGRMLTIGGGGKSGLYCQNPGTTSTFDACDANTLRAKLDDLWGE